MKKKIFNGLLMVAMMFATMGSFVSCKDYDEDAYAELQGQDRTLGEQIEELQKTLKLNYEELKGLQQQCAQNCSTALAEHKAAAEVAKQAIEQKITDVETAMKLADDALNGRVDSLAAVTADLGLTIINVKNTVSTLQQTVNNYMQKSDSIFNAHSTAIANNTSSIQDILNVHIPAVVAQAAAAQATADYALQLAKADSVKIEALDAELIDEIAKVTKLANDNLDSAKAYTDRRVEVLRTEVLDSLSLVNTRLKDLEDAYKAADVLLQEQLDKLTERVDALEPMVAANTKSINDLFDALNKVVSGVLIQGTYNPVFGSFALPVNVQSNVLMAYYGTIGYTGSEFPTINEDHYVNRNEVLSEKDIEMLAVTAETMEGGDVLVSSAGKVYVTVNPTNVNFTGKVLPIVNSLDEESAIKLTPLVYSDHKLQFGYSRSAENGFYEANATLAAEDVEKVAMKFDFNASDIKATVKDVLNPLNGVNVTNAVNTVVDVLSQFNQKLDANALKATWTDTVGTRSVYSNYNLATTAVKPLSYSFLSDLNVTKVPGLDRAENFINKMVNKVKVNLPEFNYSIEAPVIEKVELDELSPDLMAKFDIVISIDTTIVVEGQTVEIKATDIFGEPVEVEPVVVDGKIIELFITREVDMTEAVKELYAEMQKPVADLNTIVTDLNNFLGDVNNLLDEINSLNDYVAKFENAMDRYSDKLISYLDKLNNKVCSLVNSANKALQPVLLVQTNGSFARLSQAINYPSKINGTQFTLVPTSYTAEVIAPAYKKLVGVTNVYSMDRTKSAQDGDANCKAALDAANSGDIAKILNGDVQKVNFTAKKGYIYEIVYTAVDYSGKNVAKKFYVTAE